MNVLIIGGSGFVSGTLARVAVEAGHQVWTVTRGERPLPEGVRGLIVDRKKTAALRDALDGAGTTWDLAVDCIGYQTPDALQDLEVLPGRARHLVFISTDFVFDPVHRQFPQPEDSAHYLKKDYGGQKRQCERAFIEGKRTGMHWTILRPCHVYGPGSALGCFPLHARDPKLLATLQAGGVVRLAGGGHFLQQPVFVRDLAQTILSCAGNTQCDGEIYQVAGPDWIESRAYYRIIGEILGVEVRIEEIPVVECLRDEPELAPFLCHRIYALEKLRSHGLHVPSTPLEEGLFEHVMSLI